MQLHTTCQVSSRFSAALPRLRKDQLVQRTLRPKLRHKPVCICTSNYLILLAKVHYLDKPVTITLKATKLSTWRWCFRCMKHSQTTMKWKKHLSLWKHIICFRSSFCAGSGSGVLRLNSLAKISSEGLSLWGFGSQPLPACILQKQNSSRVTYR